MALLRKQRAAVREHAEYRDAARPRTLALAHHRNVVVGGAVGFERESPPKRQRVGELYETTEGVKFIYQKR